MLLAIYHKRLVDDLSRLSQAIFANSHEHLVDKLFHIFSFKIFLLDYSADFVSIGILRVPNILLLHQAEEVGSLLLSPEYAFDDNCKRQEVTIHIGNVVESF